MGGRRRGESILIYCPWHKETNPSLHVHVGHTVIPGSFRCFGCPAHGNWNKLARALNLPLFDFKQDSTSITLDDNALSSIIRETIDGFRKREIAANSVRTLKGIEDLPDNFSWRGYSTNFYNRLGCKFYWDKQHDREYLYFPLNMNGTYCGYTLASLDGKDEKYQIFAEASKLLFLYDQIIVNEPIVIVEGHFDAIRLMAEGIPAVAIFGVQNWSDIKRNYIITKHPSKILIVFDGDKAGYDAAVRVWRDIRVEFCNVDIYYIPITQEGLKLDPGNAPKYILDDIRRRLYDQ
jgi:hypothetical protein